MKYLGAGGLVVPGFSGNKGLVSDAGDKISESGATSTEIGFLAGATSNIQNQINGKQPNIAKTVFEAVWGNGTTTAGWCKLGTYTGNGLSRFVFTITGKAGWYGSDYCSQAVIHGGTNYINPDNGQLAAGCKWNETYGSGPTATSIKLVRQAGYIPHKFDLYILNNANYVNWTIEVTSVNGNWSTSIAWQQADPGTGSNVFTPTRFTVWDNGNLSNLSQLTNGPAFVSLSSALSGYAVGSNSALASTDSLLGAFGKLQGQINSRLSGNQTINLSGVVTGSGATSITTSIADGALSIAKTSGLQSALNGKRSNLSPASGSWWQGTPIVGSDGIMEVGKYIDFHDSNTGASDFSIRITATDATLSVGGLLKSEGLAGSGNRPVVVDSNGLFQVQTGATFLSTIGAVGTNPWNSQSIAIASGPSSYFQGSAVGDLCVRFGDSTKAVLLGVFDGASGTNNASLWYNKSGAGAGGSFTVTGATTLNSILNLSTSGLKFPDNAFGGGGDTAGIRLVSRSGENQSLEIYVTNDGSSDWLNLIVPDNNCAKVNGNTIWNAGNFDPATKLDKETAGYKFTGQTTGLVLESLKTDGTGSIGFVVPDGNSGYNTVSIDGVGGLWANNATIGQLKINSSVNVSTATIVVGSAGHTMMPQTGCHMYYRGESSGPVTNNLYIPTGWVLLYRDSVSGNLITKNPGEFIDLWGRSVILHVVDSYRIFMVGAF